jgi:hypothetical protein
MLKEATPIAVSYDSHYSNFTFEAGPPHVTASFFSPVLPEDLCKSSVPLNNLKVSYKAMDNKSHYVRLYSEVNGMWLAGRELPVEWLLRCPGPCKTAWKCGEICTDDWQPGTVHGWYDVVLACIQAQRCT